ncbi:MAG: CPBP family intramembrane glutamic endopeptidase [Cyanobacteriota bacterium]|nr:CPBP family intramembrane glutamic endopeptidase [Cyanobacteriota bacterium]
MNRIAQWPAPIRIGLFLFGLLILWLPVVGILYVLGGEAAATSLGSVVILYGEFVGLIGVWDRCVYKTPQPFIQHGLVFNCTNGLEFLFGLGLGMISLVCLFATEGVMGWLTWQGIPSTQVILEGLLVSVGVAWAEELLFRGWLLDELRRDYQGAVWISSSLYALLHFIKPWEEIIRTLPSFPGLLLLGLLLGWARQQQQGRLGLAIGIHAGLVWGYYLIQVEDLVRYSGAVPTWVTGIDHNPLAGGVGLVFLALLSLIVTRGIRWLA